MIDVNDLWIGDYILLKKSGRIGTFHGISSSHKIRVKVEDKIITTTLKNIEMSDTPPPKSSLTINHRPSKSKISPTSIRTTIDLHIDVLNSSLSTSRPERILDFQVSSAKKFIENAIQSKSRKIEIVHGKGEGVLKMEIKHLLGLYKEVQFTFDLNQGGATEVWFDV